jgi:hypothetical protein
MTSDASPAAAAGTGAAGAAGSQTGATVGSATSAALAISGAPASSVAAGTAYSFQPSVTGAASTNVSFAISNKPRWAIFSAATGALSGTPSAADVGSNAQIVISVSDGAVSKPLEAFSITVTPSVSSVTLSWTAPTLNTNGTSITDLAGYHIYYGTSPTSLSMVLSVNNAAATSQVIGNLTAGTWYFAIMAINSENVESALSAVLAVDLTNGASAGGSAPTASVDLSAVDNVYAIADSGTAVRNNGIDGIGSAYPENLLGASVTWSGASFELAGAGSADAVGNATIALPSGNYSTLKLLATAVNGNKHNETFIVTYTDGTSATITQSVSDWHTPQSYAGESIVMDFPYRVTADGGVENRDYKLYGYSFAINTAKTVASLTLPSDSDVVVLAATLTQ